MLDAHHAPGPQQAGMAALATSEHATLTRSFDGARCQAPHHGHITCQRCRGTRPTCQPSGSPNSPQHIPACRGGQKHWQVWCRLGLSIPIAFSTSCLSVNSRQKPRKMCNQWDSHIGNALAHWHVLGREPAGLYGGAALCRFARSSLLSFQPQLLPICLHNGFCSTLIRYAPADCFATLDQSFETASSSLSGGDIHHVQEQFPTVHS